MTDAATETVETRYGTVEIETVECDSCEETVAKEDAHPFGVWDNDAAPNERRNEADRSGYACPLCAEEGPASFPGRVRGWVLPTEERGDHEYGLAFHVGMAPFVLPIETIAGFTANSDQFSEGYATAVVTLLGWALLLGVLAAAAGVLG